MAIFWLTLLLISIALVVFFFGRTYRRLRRLRKLSHWQGEELERRSIELRLLQENYQKLQFERQRMLSFVSHDLKGPFNRIYALVQLFSLSPSLTDEQKDYLNKIQQINLDGMNMVRNLVENQRLEEKALTLETAPINLCDVIEAVAGQHREAAEKKKQKLYVELPTSAIAATDEAHLTRILDNLVSNAIKFSPLGKSIWISIADEVEQWAITVRDEGPGFKEEDHTRIFQKFQKLSARPTGGEASTGLGLWVAKTLADKLDLPFGFESHAGQGSTFWLKAAKLT